MKAPQATAGSLAADVLNKTVRYDNRADVLDAVALMLRERASELRQATIETDPDGLDSETTA